MSSITNKWVLSKKKNYNLCYGKKRCLKIGFSISQNVLLRLVYWSVLKAFSRSKKQLPGLLITYRWFLPSTSETEFHMFVLFQPGSGSLLSRFRNTWWNWQRKRAVKERIGGRLLWKASSTRVKLGVCEGKGLLLSLLTQWRAALPTDTFLCT